MAFTPDAGTNETATQTQPNQRTEAREVDDWGAGGIASDPNSVNEFAGILTGTKMLENDGEYGLRRTLRLDFTSVQVYSVQDDDPYTDDEISIYQSYTVNPNGRGPTKNSAFGKFMFSIARTLGIEPTFQSLQDALQEEEFVNALHFYRQRNVQFGPNAVAPSVWEMQDRKPTIDEIRPLSTRSSASNPQQFTQPDDDRRHLNWGDHTVVSFFSALWERMQESGARPTAVALRKAVAAEMPDDVDANFWATKGKGNPDSLWQQMVRAGIITE